ncbi:MAG: helix-turn-helix domain-containing protein [Chloroflexota bacterium]|nr:helix-turn-helix domain-containing protein [Chloroflexota bacterium]
MGRASRPKPSRLAEKVLQIRTDLGLSQNGMIGRMGLTDELLREEISLFEHGVRVPPLPVLLEYARAANVYVDALIDDDVDLPKKLPARAKSEGVRKKLR